MTFRTLMTFALLAVLASTSMGCATPGDVKDHNSTILRSQGDQTHVLQMDHMEIRQDLVPIAAGVNELLTPEQREAISEMVDEKVAALRDVYEGRAARNEATVSALDDELRKAIDKNHELDKKLVSTAATVAELVTKGLITAETAEGIFNTNFEGSVPRIQRIASGEANTAVTTALDSPGLTTKMGAVAIAKIGEQGPISTPEGILGSLLAAAGAFGIYSNKSRKDTQKTLFAKVEACEHRISQPAGQPTNKSTDTNAG